ncbi:MAG: GIY-YIG nuclease family protein [Candidatus Stahlbacteria bacterium]|nr:GIY-YIG nuclease family protein [Candidatus Stahlbacteria bacterium]
MAEANKENYYVYVLKDAKGHYYIGSTKNIERRLNEHNSGKTKSLKYRRPVKLIYYELFDTYAEAYKREFIIKSYKGSNAFKKLLYTKMEVERPAVAGRSWVQSPSQAERKI